jgi:hypothetical protein
MKVKLLSVLSDPKAPKPHRVLASKLLQKYAWFIEDSPWSSDKSAAEFLAEINADFVWRGLRTIKEIDGKDIIVDELNPSAPEFHPAYKRNDIISTISEPPAEPPRQDADECFDF